MRRRAATLPFIILAACLAVGLASAAAPAQESDPGYGKLSLQWRTYYLDRNYDGSPTRKRALATGGWIDYQSPAWRGLSLGLTVFGSQGVGFRDKDEDGTGLLAAGQGGYAVLGRAYVRGQWDGLAVTAWRQYLDTPLINRYDIRMTPVTVEALTVQACLTDHIKLMAAHVWGLKQINDTSFDSPARVAGLGDDAPVTLAGLEASPWPGLKLQLYDYYAYQFMNAVYGQADASWELPGGWELGLSAQAMDQRDTGQGWAGRFNTHMWGLRACLGYAGAKLTAGYTRHGDEHDAFNPWGGYPGFTSIQVEDNDRAGEKTWLVGLAYDFGALGLKGLSAYTLNTFSQTPDTGATASPDQNEHDFSITYDLGGALSGAQIRVRYAIVDQDEGQGGQDFSDFRIILNWAVDLLG